MKLNILGYEYDLDMSQTMEELDKWGDLNGKRLIIRIANDIPEQQKLSTLIHEIIEGINFHLSLKLEHETITLLETGLFQVLTNNGVNLEPLVKGAKK